MGELGNEQGELGNEQKEGACAVVGRHFADGESLLWPFAKFLARQRSRGVRCGC